MALANVPSKLIVKVVQKMLPVPFSRTYRSCKFVKGCCEAGSEQITVFAEWIELIARGMTCERVILEVLKRANHGDYWGQTVIARGELSRESPLPDWINSLKFFKVKSIELANRTPVFDQFARFGLSVQFLNSDLQYLLQHSIRFLRPEILNVYSFLPSQSCVTDVVEPVLLRTVSKLILKAQTHNSSVEAINKVLPHCKSAAMELLIVNPTDLISFVEALPSNTTFTEDFELSCRNSFEIAQEIRRLSQYQDANFSTPFMKDNFDVTLTLDVFPRPDGSIFVLFSYQKCPGSNPMFKTPYFKGRLVKSREDFDKFVRETILFATWKMARDDQVAQCIDENKMTPVKQRFFVHKTIH